MVSIRFNQQWFDVVDDETVLDALLREGVSVPYSCRSGACQTCMMRAETGKPPEDAQKGLKPTRKARNHFLACLCKPEMDMEVVLPTDLPPPVKATVKRLLPLSADIIEVTLTTEIPVDYRPGQFITVMSPDRLSRSYSLASVPEEDEGLVLHVRRLPGGRVSGWIHETLREGDTLECSGPLGDCFYVPGQPSQPLLLIGTGSGLAPLYGILRDALRHGHDAPIRLFHGSRDAEGLYLQNELRILAENDPRFDYTPCLSGSEAPPNHAQGRAHTVALTDIANLTGWRIFLCGHPEMVQQARFQAFLAGALLDDIHADPFSLDKLETE